jgi:hypothetical protein
MVFGPTLQHRRLYKISNNIDTGYVFQKIE